MMRFLGTHASTSPRGVARLWLRLTTLGPAHALAWAVLTSTAVVAYWASLDLHASEAEQAAAQVIGQQTLSVAEANFEAVARLLREEVLSSPEKCSPSHLEHLRRLDFDINEVKDFGVYDEDDQLICTSRMGVMPTPRRRPVADSAYDGIQVVSALVPLLSSSRTVYVLRHEWLNALIDPNRWVEDVAPQEFTVLVADRNSGRTVVEVVDAREPAKTYVYASAHFTVNVRSTGGYAQQWLAARRAWVVPILVVAALLAALVFRQLVTRIRSPLAQLERVIWFKPQNAKLVFQPVVGIDRAQVVGAEALLRLTGEKGAPISPAVVFSLLEREPTLCRRLTKLVLNMAMGELQVWLAEDRSRFVAVNVTQHDLDDETLPKYIRRLLRRYQLEPQQLHLELLETSSLASDHCIYVLQSLRDLGCELWIDDFGVGYSNLARLHKLPVHGVKLDREWVEALDDYQHVRTDAVTHLVLFAGSNGLGIVAEGVSDESAMRTLLRLGVQQMQGYLFAPGLPAKELLQLSDEAISVSAPRILREEIDKMRS